MAQNHSRRDIEQELVRCLGSTLNQLSNIWDEIGILPEMRQLRCKTVGEHLKTLLNDMVKEEEGLKRRLCDNIMKYQSELSNLCQELQTTPHQLDDSLTILMKEKELRLRVDTLNKEKHERKRRLRALQQRDQALCDLMCCTPYYIPTGTIPSKEQLNELQAHIKELETEKERRLGLYHNFKASITKMLDELEESPNTSFERDVVDEASEESFLLSNDNMKAIKLYHDDLEKRQQENFALATSLRERCHQLWDRLQHPEEERRAFTTAHTGFKPATIQALKEEVGRCELLKLQNLRQVILRTRKELEEWWDKCFYSSEQRNNFKPFHEDDFTEEALAAHDEEVKNVRNYFHDNHELLESVTRRQKLWMDFMEFERRAEDPNRFFNRGCNLLKEEKARKKIMKELPKVEQEVKEHIEQWEVSNNRQFLVGGRRFVDFIKEQWETFKIRKESEKEQRQQAKAKQTENEMMYGSKPVSTTPGKRRFAGTPARTPNKLRKIEGQTFSASQISSESCHSTASSTTSSHASTASDRFVAPKKTKRHVTIAATKQLNEMNKTPSGSVSRLAMSRTNNHTTVYSPVPPVPPRSASRPKTPSGRSLHPPPTVSSRKVLGERTQQVASSTEDLFSHTTVSSSVKSGHPQSDPCNTSLESVGHYNDFAMGLSQTTRPNCRSSVVPKPQPQAFF